MRLAHVNLECSSEMITRAVAMWILKSHEIHKLPLSMMNNIVEDIHSGKSKDKDIIPVV